MATKPGAPRSQDNVDPSQQHGIPFKTGTTNKVTLIGLQQQDPSWSAAWKYQVSEAEVAMTHVCYYTKDGVMMSKWSPLDMPARDEWRVVNQIVQ